MSGFNFSKKDFVSKVLLLTACVLFFSAQLYAQDFTGRNAADEQNIFYKNSMDQTQPDSATGKLDFYDSANSRGQSQNMGSSPLRGKEYTRGELSELPATSETRKSHMVIQLPLQGTQVLLQSDAIRSMFDTGMDGPVALHKITAHQTEPAVAAGVQGAETSSMLLQNLLYNSQQVTFAQYMSNPSLYRNAMSAYVQCMAESTSVHSDMNDGAWIKALSECTGDSVSDSVEGAGQIESSSETVFSGKDHPEMMALAAAAGRDNILLTDLMFNSMQADSQFDPAQAEQAKTSWRELFGDYELTITAQESAAGPFYAVRQGEQKRIYPVGIGASGTEERLPLSEFIRIRVERRFSALMRLLYDYCDDVRNAGGSSGFSYSGNISRLQADQEDFLSNETYAEEIQALSAPNKVINSATINAMFDLYKQRFPDVQSGAGGGTNRLNCDVFLRTPEQLNNDDYLLEFTTKLRDYVRSVVELQVLKTFEEAEEFVDERADGMGLSSELEEMAKGMIYEIAQTKDLASLSEMRMARFDEFVDKLFKERAQKSGSTAPALATTTRVRGAEGSS